MSSKDTSESVHHRTGNTESMHSPTVTSGTIYALASPRTVNPRDKNSPPSLSLSLSLKNLLLNFHYVYIPLYRSLPYKLHSQTSLSATGRLPHT